MEMGGAGVVVASACARVGGSCCMCARACVLQPRMVEWTLGLGLVIVGLAGFARDERHVHGREKAGPK